MVAIVLIQHAFGMASEITGVEQQVFKDFLKTNVIAAVVGYQTQRTIGLNLKITSFSILPDAGNGEEKGVLFQVVAPLKFAEKYFWMHHDGLMGSGKSFELYPPNLLFSFRFNADTNDIASITESALFDISVSGRSLCTLRPLGVPLFTVKTEIEGEVKKIEANIISVSNRIEEANMRLKTLETKTKEYNRCLGVVRYCKGALENLIKQKSLIAEKVADTEKNELLIRMVIQENVEGERLGIGH
jgi:hypothetical protein